MAIEGERFDAHAFLKDVIRREVAAILVSQAWAEGTGKWAGGNMQKEVLTQARERGVAVIAVEDTVAGLNRLAAAYRSNEITTGFRAKVIAVGGSNGKTTTKRILHALLAEKYGNAGGTASPKSFNNNIGMPLTLLEVMPGHDYVVLEIGTNAPGEIAALGAVCRPDVALITSIGLEHLEKLTDLAGVAREEASIAGHVAAGGAGGMMIVPEVEELKRELAMAAVQKVWVGMGKDERRKTKDEMGGEDEATLVLSGVEETVQGTSFSVNGRGRFFVPLLGAHNAMNALMAIAAARRMGVSDEQIAAGLLKVKPAEGRFEPMEIGGWKVIHDAYNANPSSVEASLRTFARVTASGGRRVVVLADMLELGEAGPAMHRKIGELVGELKMDVFVAIGSLMGLAAEEAEIEMAGSVVRFGDTAAAARELRGLLKPGDTILLKGSHSMALERLIDTLRVEAPPEGGTTKWPA